MEQKLHIIGVAIASVVAFSAMAQEASVKPPVLADSITNATSRVDHAASNGRAGEARIIPGRGRDNRDLGGRVIEGRPRDIRGTTNVMTRSVNGPVR